MHRLLISVAAIATTTFGAMAQDSTQPNEADTTEREVTFTSADGADLGTAELIGTGSGLLIRLNLQDLPADQWLAFHLHEGEECDADGQFKSAGGHWNPDETPHGYLIEGGPHAGDMPNLYVDSDGRLLADVVNKNASLSGDTGNVMGRALILHAGADDYSSQPSGDAGDRIACAVIE
ncbi:Cu-Zn family superoxide dismutase [Roseovarius sp. MBR-154]|jgi:Cu-Zn family superoxide dismutase